MDTKKKKILWLELAGFMFTLVAGTVMHFGLELTGFARSWAWLFPVNESPWEHLKLSFYPIVFWGLILYAILRLQQDLESVSARRCTQLLVCPAAGRVRGHYDHGSLLVAAVLAHGHINTGR